MRVGGLLRHASRPPVVLPACTCSCRTLSTPRRAPAANVASSAASTSALAATDSPSAAPDRPALSSKALRHIKRRKTPPYEPPAAAHRFPRAELRSRLDVAQFLPHVVRERNFLLANLRHQLKTPWVGQIDAVWAALVAAVQYPDVRPTLPLSQRPSSSRPEDEYHERIKFTTADLVGAFGVLSRARPRTRAGLSRLLVVVELIAMKAGAHLGPIPPAAGAREFEIRALRGGGIGLGDREWKALIRFAGLSYRAPRPEPDVSSTMSLFSQWSATRDSLSPAIDTNNTLLLVAVKSRSWGLVEGIEERMLREGVLGNARTYGIRMKMAAERGAHTDSLWALFEVALLRLDNTGSDADRTVAWNSMIWHLGERGQLGDARAMFHVMCTGARVDLRTLAPRTDLADPVAPAPLVVDPPPPDIATFTSLIQALAHHGDLRGALSIVDRMIRTTSEPSARIAPCDPTVSIFGSLFRGFTVHGVDPSASPWALDARLLAGRPGRANANATIRGPGGLFPALRPPAAASADWSLAALHRLFTAFLALPPPSAAVDQSFGGQRSAPTSKHVFWVLLAFDKLSGGDSRLVLDVWDALVDQFGAGDDPGHPNRPAWRGWLIDPRVRRRVDEHQRKVAEQEEGREDHTENQRPLKSVGAGSGAQLAA